MQDDLSLAYSWFDSILRQRVPQRFTGTKRPETMSSSWPNALVISSFSSPPGLAGVPFTQKGVSPVRIERYHLSNCDLLWFSESSSRLMAISLKIVGLRIILPCSPTSSHLNVFVVWPA